MKLTCNAWRRLPSGEVEIWFKQYGVWIKVYPAIKSIFYAQYFLSDIKV